MTFLKRCRQAAERFAAQEATLHGAKQSLDQAREEVDTLRCQLAQALARERETAEVVEDERRVARQKIAELEDAIAESKREGALLRERTEGRLEKLRLVAEEEEEENDFQVFMRVIRWRNAVQKCRWCSSEFFTRRERTLNFYTYPT